MCIRDRILSESVSTIYTMPIVTSIIGISSAKAIAHTTPPRNSEPVSPINTLAG